MDGVRSCAVCGKNAVFYSTYLKQDLCKKHFERMIIRRVRGNMASNGIRGYQFHLDRENSCGFAFLSFLFKEGKDSRKMNLMSNTLEDFSTAVMRFFLFHEETGLKIVSKGRFSPLFNVSEKEIVSFFAFKKKKVSAVSRNDRDNAVMQFILKIEERRPGAMISLVKVGIELGII